MDKRKNIEATERIQSLLKETISEKAYEVFADTFDVEIGEKKQVTVLYHGTTPYKLFKRKCKAALCDAVHTALGKDKKVKIAQKITRAQRNIRAIKFFALGMVFVCIALSIAVVLANYIGNRHFRETFYSASSIKVDSRLRVIQLSDLHGATYGENNKDLLERIEALKPDVILLTGDIVDSPTDEVDYAVNLAKGLAKIAPSYYVYGNNEAENIYSFALNQTDMDKLFGFDDSNRDESILRKVKDTYEDQLEAAGVKVLKNEMDTITVKNMTVDIYGVLTSNPSSFWSYTAQSFSNYIYKNPDHIKITAVHEPYIFEEFEPDYWGDLLVCGHTHGGLMRVPLLGPLYTEEGGLFPERGGDYVYGRYDAAGKPLIVSGGLENSNILRINNQPELVIIDVNKF